MLINTCLLATVRHLNHAFWGFKYHFPCGWLSEKHVGCNNLINKTFWFCCSFEPNQFLNPCKEKLWILKEECISFSQIVNKIGVCCQSEINALLCPDTDFKISDNSAWKEIRESLKDLLQTKLLRPWETDFKAKSNFVEDNYSKAWTKTSWFLLKSLLTMLSGLLTR